MNSKVKILLSIVAMSFVMVGCGGGGSGGGGSDSPSTAVNSSENCEGDTSLGFYGADVVIGSHSGNKFWSIEVEGSAGQIILEIPDYGNELYVMDTSSGSRDFYSADYGVSSNGKTINIDDNFDGSTDIRIEIDGQVNSQTYDAYMSNAHTNEGINIILMTTTD